MAEPAKLITPDGDRDDPGVAYNSDQAAKYLQVSRATLQRWRTIGCGPRYSRTVPGNMKSPVRYTKGALDEFLKVNEVRSTAEES